MTDDEIFAKLKEGQDLLSKYKEVVAPVAEELAKRKSLFVFGKEGAYTGDLGCFEEGLNSICLHITPEFHGRNYKEYQAVAGERPYDFDYEWSKKAVEAGVVGIHISGYY